MWPMLDPLDRVDVSMDPSATLSQPTSAMLLSAWGFSPTSLPSSLGRHIPPFKPRLLGLLCSLADRPSQIGRAKWAEFTFVPVSPLGPWVTSWSLGRSRSGRVVGSSDHPRAARGDAEDEKSLRCMKKSDGMHSRVAGNGERYR
jgi:hypothetical protein